MKTSSLVLSASVAINAIFLGLFVLGAQDRAQRTETEVATPTLAVSASKSSESSRWTDLTSDGDLAATRDRLRAEGFSPAMIRAILSAQLDERFAARRRAIEAGRPALQFWKNARYDPSTNAALNALNLEERRALRDLLGRDPNDYPASMFARQLPQFSEAKIDQLADIRERYDEQRQAIFGRSPFGRHTAQESEQINALDQALRADYAAILSPQELEDFNLRASDTAQQLRSHLSVFDPSEAEYRALFQIQNDYDARYGMSYNSYPSQAEARAQAQAEQAKNDAIAAALGPDRYADYQRANDYNFKQTANLVTRLELPAEAAVQVYAVQKEIQDRISPIYAKSRSAEESAAQIAALSAEAQARLTAVLGERGYEAYKQYGGSWLNQIAPRPARE